MHYNLTTTQILLLLNLHDGRTWFHFPDAAYMMLRRLNLIDEEHELTSEGEQACTDLLHRLETDPASLTLDELEALGKAYRLDDDTLARIVLDERNPTANRLLAFKHLPHTIRGDERFTRLAHDPDPTIRLDYVQRSVDDGARLEELYADETDPVVLIWLIERIEPAHAVKYVTHENPRVRIAALEALPDGLQQEQARRMLDDPDLEVFDKAIQYADGPLNPRQTERALSDETTAQTLASHGVGMTADTIRRLLNTKTTADLMQNRLDEYRRLNERLKEWNRIFDNPEASPIARECRDA